MFAHCMIRVMSCLLKRSKGQKVENIMQTLLGECG